MQSEVYFSFFFLTIPVRFTKTEKMLCGVVDGNERLDKVCQYCNRSTQSETIQEEEEETGNHNSPFQEEFICFLIFFFHIFSELGWSVSSGHGAYQRGNVLKPETSQTTVLFFSSLKPAVSPAGFFFLSFFSKKQNVSPSQETLNSLCPGAAVEALRPERASMCVNVAVCCLKKQNKTKSSMDVQ